MKMTKNLKRIMACGLAMVMVLGTLTSCGGSESGGNDAASQTAKEGVLTVGLDDTFVPMGYRDENNNLVGFDIDFANAVGEELGMEIEFKPIQWNAKDMELESKNIDCVWNGMSVTPERMEAMALSNKYLDNTIVVMTLSGNSDVKVEKMSDLANYKIATQADSAALEMLKADSAYDSYKDNITEYDTYDNAILDMKAGRADLIVVDQVLAEYKNNISKGEFRVLDFKVGEDAYAIGFRKDDTALRDAVNDAIKALIDNGKAEEISNKWFGKNIVIFEELE